MNPLTEGFCKLLNRYFDALVRGGTQTQIDEARLAVVNEYDRVAVNLTEVTTEYFNLRLKAGAAGEVPDARR